MKFPRPPKNVEFGGNLCLYLRKFANATPGFVLLLAIAVSCRVRRDCVFRTQISDFFQFFFWTKSKDLGTNKLYKNIKLEHSETVYLYINYWWEPIS